MGAHALVAQWQSTSLVRKRARGPIPVGGSWVDVAQLAERRPAEAEVAGS
jgi:hypothetical protein